MDPTTFLIIGAAIAIILLIIGLLISAADERALVDKRLEYLDQDTIIDPTGKKATPVGDWFNKQAERYSWGQALARSLARADIKLKVGEFIALEIILMIVCAFLGWYLGGGAKVSADSTMADRLAIIPGILIGGGIGLLAPNIYLKREQGRRLVRFDGQLADMLNLMVNGLRAGYSNMQAMEAVSRELPAPISDEFRRVVQEMQLGIPMESAMDNLIRRIPSKDLDLVVTATNVQREVGGNLAEILDTISHTIRERIRVKGEIKVLVSQVMLSGRVLALMPVALIIGMYFLNRDYMMRFFNEGTRMYGIPALILGAFLIIAGYITMTRIANIEV
jgi:tight adherence protein B